MKLYMPLLLAGLITACHGTGPVKETPPQDSLVATTPNVVYTPPVVKDTADPSRPPADSNAITGDFNGDGQTDTAYIVRTKNGYGNPMEDDGVADEYAVRFAGNKLPDAKIGCCEARLFNEGDLNLDGADEFSVYQWPMNGTVCDMTTLTFRDHRWQPLITPFVIPTGAEYLSDEDIQRRVFLEKGIIYFMDVDPNDDHFKLVKKKATLQ